MPTRTTKLSIEQAKEKCQELYKRGFTCEEQVMHWLILEYLLDSVDNLQSRCRELEREKNP